MLPSEVMDTHKYAAIYVTRTTHRLAETIAKKEQRALCTTVQIALTYYQDYLKRLEQAVDDLHPVLPEKPHVP